MLSVEGDLLAMGIWTRIFGGTLTIIGGLFSLLGVMAAAVNPNTLGPAILMVVVFAMGWLAYNLGRGLQQHNDTSRIWALVLALLSLVFTVGNFFFVVGASRAGPEVVGTIVGALIGISYHGYAMLILSRAATVCSPGYAQTFLHDGAERPSPYKSVFWWGNLLMFIIFIGSFIVGATAGGRM